MIDRSALEKLRDVGGTELVVEIIDLFNEDAPRLVERARTDTERGGLDEAARVGHQLKSSSATIGAPALTALCQQLEAAAARNDRVDALAILDAMAKTVRAIGPTLRALKAEG